MYPRKPKIKARDHTAALFKIARHKAVRLATHFAIATSFTLLSARPSLCAVARRNVPAHFVPSA